MDPIEQAIEQAKENRKKRLKEIQWIYNIYYPY